MEGISQIQVIAHRGASGYLPEHTLEAKAMAFAMGADFLEQDVVLTRDGIPVVLHDIHLDTVTDVADQFDGRQRTDGRFYAIDFDLAEIKQLHASERFDRKTGEAVFPGRFPVKTGDFRVPTLEEEIQLIQGMNHSTGRAVGIYPELKHPEFHYKENKDLAVAVLEVLSRHGFATKDDPIFLQCFDESELQRVRSELGCQLSLVQLLSDAEWMSDSKLRDERQARLADMASYAEAIGPSFNSVFRADPLGGIPLATELTADAHQSGLAVHPWTYRTDALPKNFQSFEQLHQATVLAGLDGVFTDFPDQSFALLQQLSSEAS